MPPFLGLAAVFALVFINGFFVAAEFGLVGARETRIAQLASEGNAGAKSARYAMQHLDSYIAATQLGITLASLGLGWIGEPVVAHLIEPVMALFMTEKSIESIGHPIAVAVGFALVTMLHIVLGELAPKSIALQRPEGTSIVVSRPTTLFLRIFKPVIFLMNTVGNGIVRLIGFEPVGSHAQIHSVEELHMLVKSSGEAGLLEKSEEQMFHRVFDFGDITVEEIMQPRVEVESIPLNVSLSALLVLIESRHHSRYPVYADTVDTVVGILHVKDLFDQVIKQPELLTQENAVFDLQSLLLTPIFVPEKLPVDHLLEQMQKTKVHLAVIIDEFGGMAGIVTMEDILEELVGEVQDEFDESESVSIKAEGDMAIVDGMVSVSEIIERFGEPDKEHESTTIGGYVGEQLGRIPKTGDVVNFGSYSVTVDEMDGMRVARVRFRKPNPRPKSGDDDTGDDKRPHP